jgi:hypothetical protein
MIDQRRSNPRRLRIDDEPKASDRELLLALAKRLHRLVPSYRDPEKYHLEKDQIAKKMVAIARRISCSDPIVPSKNYASITPA